MSTNTTLSLNFDASGVELIHSSEIIEFFWFFTSFLLLLFTALRIFKYHDDFSSEEKPKPAVSQPPVYRQSDPQQQNIYEKGSTNQEDKIALDDIHVSNPGQEHLESPEVALEKGIHAPQGQERRSFRDFMENLIFRFMPFLGIAILNIVNFGSYIFLAFMTTFWFLVVFFCNYLKIFQKYELESAQPLSEFFHLFLIFSMFINYFVNDQSQM